MVETFHTVERSTSAETADASRSSDTLRGARRGQLAHLERDDALAHLVDHLASCGDHEDGRAGPVDPMRSCIVPTDVSGSRFPVGSSQTSSGGRSPSPARSRRALLAAREPPDASHLVREADGSITSGTFLRSPRSTAPARAARSRCSAAVRFGRSLKSWKTQPRLRRSSGTFERFGARGRVLRR